MALDVGERRVGVAMSDLSQTLATPYTTMQAHPQAILFQKSLTLGIVQTVVVHLVKVMQHQKLIMVCHYLIFLM